LNRFCLVDPALPIFQEYAGAPGLVGQNQPLAVGRQPRVSLNETGFALLQESCQTCNFDRADSNLSLDAAALAATLAIEILHTVKAFAALDWCGDPAFATMATPLKSFR
jgi:hypothetical protein